MQREQFSPQRWRLQTADVIKLGKYRRLLETRVKSRYIGGTPAGPARVWLERILVSEDESPDFPRPFLSVETF